MGNGLAYENTPTTIQWMNTPSCFLTGKPETLKGDKKEMGSDRRELRQDRKELRRDVIRKKSGK